MIALAMCGMSVSASNTTGAKILIVDDFAPVRMTYAEALRGAGYEVIEAGDGQEALDRAAQINPSLIMLDVDMPVLDGWKTLEKLQESGRRQPVIMLTGAKEISERVRGLGLGADDYLCKPCDVRELLARVHAVLRRSQPEAPGCRLLQFGPTTVDLANRAAHRAGEPVPLTRTEYAILDLFARNLDQLVSREMMLADIWGYSAQSNTRTVETHIWRLRQKLNDHPGNPRWIQTVPTGGYRMMKAELGP